MSVAESILLGIIQGLFMFIPVSSSSHLALAQNWLAAQGSPLPSPDTPEMILFNLVVHVGTMVSVVVVMYRPLVRLLRGTASDIRWFVRRRTLRHLVYLRMMLLGVVTVGITGVLGLFVREYGTVVFATPQAIAGLLLITGVVLWWTDSVKDTWRGPTQMTLWVGVMIGLAQAAALFPGLSRSGMTIAMALALGMHRRIAAQYSFFVAIPTILSAMVVQALQVAGEPITLGVDVFAWGFVVSAVVGAFALWLVLRLLYRGHFRVFSVYVVALALVVLAVPADWTTG